jgi:hypothetical protein
MYRASARKLLNDSKDGLRLRHARDARQLHGATIHAPMMSTYLMRVNRIIERT